jgi:3'-phosphoadenosine 5'-phosphosulfate sulfotransferase (PAPS reductase)/FAD synthetase
MYGMTVQDLFEDEPPQAAPAACEEFIPKLDEYESAICFNSGGKDSIACVLHLLELGMPRSKIEIHHHLVDGDDDQLMEWPVTRDYTRKFAAAFGLRYVESWRVGGFRREMLRENAQTAPVAVPMPDGTHLITGGDRSKCSTRRKFPQVSPDLRVRWCSSSLKIECASRYFSTNPIFQDGRKRLVITGERAEESANRAHYKGFEPSRSDNRGGKFVDRYLDQWRAVHAWPEQRVWDILKRWKVCPHPAYYIGLGRASCAHCLFSSDNQIATMRFLDPKGHTEIANYEREFGVTIHRNLSIGARADKGEVLAGAYTDWGRIAMSATFDHPIFVDDWQLPPGAMSRECAGPT